MKNYEYWKNFVNTGKIDDYLHYIACTQEEGTDVLTQVVDISKRSIDISTRGVERDKEGGFIAGINYCNWDGSFGHAGW
ncbi:MAG: hypothetical protein PHF63_13615 [Herbinix sp.]|nr:hypothetical protein [Herbinix sp.]